MRERPILYSGPMVQQVLADRKTQTRRILTPQPAPDRFGRYRARALGTWLEWVEPGAVALSPYGQPGDRLWVRETWGLALPTACDGQYVEDWDDWELPIPKAKPPGRWVALYAEDWRTDSASNAEERGFRWRPSIHMPRWASRCVLEVSDLRVERLQDITEADILAEGVTVERVSEWCDVPWSDMPTLHDAWRVLWDHINGERAAWASNPWVWVVGFRRLP